MTVVLDDLPLVTRTFLFGRTETTLTAADDQDQLLRQTDGRDMLPFGLMLWESAVLLADAVSKANVAGKRVLDLGCGAGLPGIVAAQHGAKVLAADHDPLALTLCTRNAHANRVGHNIETRQVDWRLWRPEPVFDVILGADIVYDRDDHDHVLHVVSQAAAPGATLLLTDPCRADTRQFVAQLGHTFSDVRSTTHIVNDLIVPGQTVQIDLLEGRRPICQ